MKLALIGMDEELISGMIKKKHVSSYDLSKDGLLLMPQSLSQESIFVVFFSGLAVSRNFSDNKKKKPKADNKTRNQKKPRRGLVKESIRSNRIIVFMNNKGGTGKTTSAFNVAKNYLRNNRNVACVDFDQQEQLQRLLPEITRTGLSADDLPDISCDYVIVDTGPTFNLDHMDLMDVADMIIIPVQLEGLDMTQSLKLLKTIHRTGHAEKARIMVTHSGKNTILYKSLLPVIKDFANAYGIEILSIMRKSQAVAQATMSSKTVFEINSPPEVRSDFKELFKAINKSLVKLAPLPVKEPKAINNGGESCLAH